MSAAVGVANNIPIYVSLRNGEGKDRAVHSLSKKVRVASLAPSPYSEKWKDVMEQLRFKVVTAWYVSNIVAAFILIFSHHMHSIHESDGMFASILYP